MDEIVSVRLNKDRLARFDKGQQRAPNVTQERVIARVLDGDTTESVQVDQLQLEREAEVVLDPDCPVVPPSL